MNLQWDDYSDQPHIIKDKTFKKSIYKKSALDEVVTILTTIVLSPFVALSYLLFQTKRDIDTTKFFSMSVNLDKNPKESLDLINELGVDSLLVRFPLSDMKNLDRYVEFVESFKDKEIVINILQDRENITNLELFEKNISLIFESFKDIKEFQIANAINRKKWAFWKMSEYLSFFEVAKRVRDEKFKDKKLLGSSVIDFEYHYSIRSLFNLYSIKYDKFTSLLYVDRRGDPQNSQMGFNLKRKIHLLNAIISISPKTKNNLYITETNWPLSNTAPYAPTSERECVSEDDYAFYMVIYYLLSLSTNQVDRVFWHQLIAPGYGLIDNRDGIKKYPAFYAYKTMMKLLKGAVLKEYVLGTKIKLFKFKKGYEIITIYYSDENLDLKSGINIYGEPFSGGKFAYVVTFS
jgi:hypothetical protein